MTSDVQKKICTSKVKAGKVRKKDLTFDPYGSNKPGQAQNAILEIAFLSAGVFIHSSLSPCSCPVREFSFQFGTICKRDPVEVGGTIRKYLELI